MFGYTWLKKIYKIVKHDLEVDECIHRDVIRILKWIALKKIDFIQAGGGMNFSIVRGTAGSFKAVLTPDNGAMAAGTVPSWAADDGSVQVGPAADGLSANIVAPLGSTVTTFNLQIKATSSDPSIGDVANTHAITVTEPVAAPLTAIDFVQTAG